MKKTILLTAILLTLSGGVASCGKDDEEEIYPSKTILGKWELVELEYSDGRKEAYQPTGYIEYLLDGTMKWYDYSTSQYEILQGKYWMDFEIYEMDVPISIDTVWYLHYEHINLDDESMYEYYPDKPLGFSYEINFITNSQMSLWCIDIWSYVAMPKYIYKRKK
ncbi:MAG: hypothetical protein LBE13_10250 [Bacteroidales bacterium]|jgi:hypothetical protein|nr:hypothetical protein [Bacteroidales bacterium]